MKYYDPIDHSTVLAELRNGWGAAPWVWGAMAKIYIPDDPFFMTLLDGPRAKEFWELAWRDDVPEHHRWAMALTFDTSIVAAIDYVKAANMIHRFVNDEEFKRHTDPGHVNHWPAIADLLDGEWEKWLWSKPGYSAVGIWHTSVTSNTFTRWVPDPDDEEEGSDQPVPASQLQDITETILGPPGEVEIVVVP